jgi:hypothetical protein
MKLYHGGTDIVDKPRIIISESGRDFGSGFYTTDIKEQAEKWAKRKASLRINTEAILNIYEFDESAYSNISCKTFVGYTMEWLDLVVDCRHNPKHEHGYDLVVGKIADDDVGETVQAVVNGLAPKEFALEKLTFMSANSQICFCNEKALGYLRFVSAEKVI